MKLIGLMLLAGVMAGQGLPPIVFVHGNGDDATKWVPTIWLFESNGYPAHLLRAVRLTDPSARRDNTKPEAFRSSTTDQASELAAFVTRTLIETQAQKVVLVGSSRGGMTIRNYLKNGGGAAVTSHAILCGTPNHGVIAMDGGLDFEFNGKGHFLRQLNEGSEVVPGVKFLTLRSDTQDKYAQPNVGYDSPALAGAENIVLPGLDHREVAFHPLAFGQMYRWLTGRAVTQARVVAEATPKVSGLVTGFGNNAATNRPLEGARFRVFAVEEATGERAGQALLDLTTDATGAWGPLTVDPKKSYEFVLEKDGKRVSYFMSGLERSTGLLNFRMVPAPAGEPGRLIIHRPQGYFSKGRDPLLLNGEPVAQLTPGVPTADSVTVTVNGGVAKVELREEKIVARPAREAGEVHFAELLWE